MYMGPGLTDFFGEAAHVIPARHVFGIDGPVMGSVVGSVDCTAFEIHEVHDVLEDGLIGDHRFDLFWREEAMFGLLLHEGLFVIVGDEPTEEAFFSEGTVRIFCRMLDEGRRDLIAPCGLREQELVVESFAMTAR